MLISSKIGFLSISKAADEDKRVKNIVSTRLSVGAKNFSPGIIFISGK